MLPPDLIPGHLPHLIPYLVLAALHGYEHRPWLDRLCLRRRHLVVALCYLVLALLPFALH